MGLVAVSSGDALAAARVGGAFQVNTLGGRPSFPDVAVSPDGEFVVVWQAEIKGGVPAIRGNTSIYGQRFDASGAALSGQSEMNNLSSHTDVEPRVAKADDGSFVVSWRHDEEGVEFDSNETMVRRFATSGEPIGLQQLVRRAFLFSSSPSLAVNPDGAFVLAWSEAYGCESGGFNVACMPIFARRYDSAGSGLGGLISVELEIAPAFVHIKSSVAMDSSGGFVAIWAPSQPPSPKGVVGQRYAANGSPVGASFEISATSGPPSAVAMAPDGTFVVTWKSFGSSGSDNDGSSIQARRYDANGVAQGGEFQVNVVTAGHQQLPSISLASNGGFVIAWVSDSSAGTDTSGPSIQARRFLADGTAVGGQFQVNSLLDLSESSPRVAVRPDGDFVIVWASSTGASTHFFSSIEAQRYTPAALESPETTCDDFFDNDEDGAADCADPQCNGVSGCTFGAELSCIDAIDNDGDGFSDCADSECDGVGSCESATELSCSDGFDNDGDSRLDCRDSDCLNTGICEGLYELSCDDGGDNDSDGDTDCDDLDCQSVFLCSTVSGVPSLSGYSALALVASLVAGALWLGTARNLRGRRPRIP